MKGRIETACFHCSGGREMIYASNREAEWLNHVMDVRTCYDKLFGKTSGTSILLLSPVKTGIMLIVSKIIYHIKMKTEVIKIFYVVQHYGKTNWNYIMLQIK